MSLISRGASLHSKGGAAQSEESAQAQPHNPLPNIGGSGNDTRTRGISRGANGCGRSSGGGENSGAGTNVSVHSFYCDGHLASIRGSSVAMQRGSVHEAREMKYSISGMDKAL